MSLNITYKVANIQQLLAAFEKAPDAVKRNMVLAMNVATKRVQEYARQNHPSWVSRSGKAEQAIQTDVTQDATNGILGEVFLDPAVPWATYLHVGTGIHGPRGDYIKIFPRTRKYLRWAVPGGFVFAKKVLFNPGIKGDEYLYHAGENQRAVINAVFDQYSSRAIKEVGLG